MKNKYNFFLIILIISLFIGGCNRNSSQSESKANEHSSDTLMVYTTIFPIEDFTKKIGGKYVDVKSVYPAGADAHTFEPTLKTMMDIADADLFIYNGAGFESFIDKAAQTMVNEKVVMVEASHGIELLSGNEQGHGDHAHDEEEHDEHDHVAHDEGGHDEHDHHHDHDQDPHIWMDPINAIEMAENIKASLTEAMPSAKDDFEKNYQDLKVKLEKLDVDLREAINSAKHQDLLVSHASYGYWEHRYGIHQISITGLSPENEPSQKRLQSIIEAAKEHNIHYIVFDQVPSAKVVDTVQKETKTTAVTLHNLEYITQEDKNNKEDYFTIMNKNVETLKTILEK